MFIKSEYLELTGSVDTYSPAKEAFTMPNPRPPYSAEFHHRLVELVRAGRTAIAFESAMHFLSNMLVRLFDGPR